MQLYPDKPQSKGVENALKRARQMVELQWVPVKKIPSGYIIKAPSGRVYVDGWLPAHLPQQGAIYSSVRLHCKFIGSNVSLETYMTALANPNSVLYTRPQHGLGRSMFSYYGIVCSAFASYVCQLPYPVACKDWPRQKDVSPVDTTALENLQLCDLIVSTGHIAVITGILRDVDGNMGSIIVSESVAPICRRTAFTPEQFRGYWLNDGYSVYRYAGIHDVTYTPNPYVRLEDDPLVEIPPYNTTFMADFGNKANYRLDETVEFSIFEDGWETLEITGPDGSALCLPINGDRMTYTPSAPGFHTAVCRKGDEFSQSVEFCAVEITSAPEKEVFSVGEPIEIRFRNNTPGDEVYYVQTNTHDLFYVDGRLVTPEEIAAGKVSLTYPLEPGTYVITLIAENKFGRYAFHCDPISVK